MEFVSKIMFLCIKFCINTRTIKGREFSIYLYKPFRMSALIMFYSGKLGNVLLKLLVTKLQRSTGYWLDDVIEILHQNKVESAPKFFFFFRFSKGQAV